MATRSINTILNLRDRMSRGLQNATRNTRLLRSNVRSSDNAIRRFSRNVQNNIKKATRTVKNLTLAGAGIASAFAVKTGFAEAFDMEGFRVQLETATKSAETAGKKMVWAVNYANKTPFETGSIVEATARLEAMKLNAEKWLPDIADMAGSTSKDIGQAYEAVIDATVGEFERLKEFGIKKNDLIARADKMYGKNAVFNTKGSVTDQLKLQKVLIAEMQSRYKGGAEKLSKTTKGLWSTVTGITKSSLAKIVGMQEDGTIKQGSLLMALKSKIQVVADALTKWQQDGTMDKIANKVTQTFNLIVSSIKNVFTFIKKHEKLISSLLVGFLAFQAVIKVIAGIKTAMVGLNIVFGIFNGTLAVTPLGWIVIGITAIIMAIYALWRNWDKVSKFLNKTVKIVKDTFVNQWNNAKNSFFNIINNIKNNFINKFTDIKNFFIGIKDSIVNITTQIGQGFNNMFTGLMNSGKGFLNFFIGLLNKLINSVNKIQIEIPDWIPEYGGKTFGVNIPNIPEFAKGTNHFNGGLARINEKGGEIVNLPNGSSVIPADKSKRLIDNTKSTNITTNQQPINIKVTIQGNVYGEKDLVNKIGDTISKKVKLALSNM